MKKKNKPIIIVLLVIAQLYFTAAAGSYFENGDENLKTSNETYLTNSFVIYSSEANVNNKTLTSEKVLNSQLFLNDNFYAAVLIAAEDLGLLFFINTENNPNQLLSVITKQSIPRSPPLA